MTPPRHLVLPTLLLLAGCAPDAPDAAGPQWVRLALQSATFSPPPPGVMFQGVDATVSFELDPQVGERVVWTLPPSVFRPDLGLPGVYFTTLPSRIAESVNDEPTLAVGSRALEMRRPNKTAWSNPAPDGAFTMITDRLLVFQAGGAAITEPVRLELPLGEPSRREGPWRLHWPDYHADGFTILRGGATEVTFPRPADSALSFQVAALAIDTDPAASTRLLVELDGEPLHEVEAAFGGPQSVRVPLPADARGASTVRFTAEGSAALVGVFEPTVGPLDFGTYGDRPWEEDRPDLVVLLADTFRADNLTYYRGHPGGIEAPLTPRLDAFAEESVRFRRSWSTAPWTLPSQASLMTGLEPMRHTAIAPTARLPRSVETIAERLSDAGYRTGNINDQAFLSAHFGLDQGFQRHDERAAPAHDLVGTLERVKSFLEADDGRPVFLYVQSYRAHTPYWASDESRDLVSPHLPLAEDCNVAMDALDDAVQAIHRVLPPEDPNRSPLDVVPFAPTPDATAAVDSLHGLYRAGVRETDEGFGEIVDALDASGLGRQAYVVFTSDHGEAFGEHRLLFHKQSGAEVLARVPLFLRGPGLAPRDVEHPVSGIDVTPTFVALAGLEPEPEWRGSSLLEVDGIRPLFIEECGIPSLPQGWYAVLGDTKLFAGERYEEPVQVDLAADPSEASPLLPGDAGYDPAIVPGLMELREMLLEPLYEQELTKLPSEMRDHLRALGYTTEE